jgi:hypothetical protein
MPNFPGPNINRIIDTDPQIVKVPMDKEDWGARMSGQPKNVSNSMTIRHVGNDK